MSVKINDKSNKTYIVLGVPHSATSFIAQSLEKNGVDMGTKESKEGFYENPVFLNLNKEIRNNPHCPKINDKIRRAIKKNKPKFWGFKDPRTCLSFEHYLPHLDEDVYLICCFRKPKYIIKALKRGKSWRGKEKKMIDLYNKSIINIIKKFCKL